MIEKLLKIMLKQNASDLFLKFNSVPHLRIDGKICPLASGKKYTKDNLEQIIKQISTSKQRENIKHKLEINYVFVKQGIGRFRANIFMEKGMPAIVLRAIKSGISSFEELNLPSAILEKFCSENRGLILITGNTGSGKSTTIASMIDYINEHSQKHILTVEQAAEVLFKDKKSIISQREIGTDTLSYTCALRNFMLQSPDVIFIDNIRDQETMFSALRAAETGQLVLSTLHTINVSQSIERIANFFPPYQHPEIRMQLSLLLKGVISLRLIPRKDKEGRIPVSEIMVRTSTIADLISKGDIAQIPEFIERGEISGMQTFEQNLLSLYRQEKISLEEAKKYSDNLNDFTLKVEGIGRLEDDER